MADVINLQRLDLLKTCLLNKHAWGDAHRTIAALPDSEFRQKTAIMMMRIPTANFWPNEKLLLNRSGPAVTGMHEPFISTVTMLLPGETLKDEMVATQAARNKLADRLLAALIAQGATISAEERPLLEASPGTPQSPVPQAPPQRTPPAGLQAPSAMPASRSAGASQPGHDQGSPAPLFWLTAGALVLAALAWLAWKTRRKN